MGIFFVMTKEDIDYFRGIPLLQKKVIVATTNIHKSNYHKELDDYTKALSYAPADSEHLPTLLAMVEELSNKIKNCETILKAVYET